MFALNEDLSVTETFKVHPNIPFARIPIYKESIDHITGIVRRRDLHNSILERKTHNSPLKNLSQEAIFVPEKASLDKALRLLLAEHVQLCVVVDEFGSLVGVLAMEDIVESILGQEIFEHDDLAVDMRELAKKKYLNKLDASNQKNL